MSTLNTTTIPLRPNQQTAIDTTIANDFNSGIHFHATGSGKSLIAIHIILEYYARFKEHNIMWICEKKSILIDQFNIKNIRDKNCTEIIRKFNILNFSENKLKNWYDSVNAAKYWNKPVLLIINRAFLTSSENYKNIKLPFHLIIHDECHTFNASTKKFYENMFLKSNIKCIGFSATPRLDYKPYDKIISTYSIYDAYKDKMIVPPVIKWFTCDALLEQTEIVQIIKDLIEKESELVYKKVIIWCGMIELCTQMAQLWQQYFRDYLICVDTSKDQTEFASYSDFQEIDTKALLFCAGKHREGSDIKNLDACIFLDKVETRCPKVFVQCIGRVLRLDKAGKKKYGLVIDVKAKSSYNIINNISKYLYLPDNIFPWTFDYKIIYQKDKLIKINSLQMSDHISTDANVDANVEQWMPTFTNLQECTNIIQNMFVRPCPNDDLYINRLNMEIELLYNKNLVFYLFQAIEILKMTHDIPHITRGSCGSSLVCYLLGISHVDPILNKVNFARFLNNYRNNLPDIDLDFPHNLREEVFLKIELKWPNKVARISNHVFFHDKSAMRQAIRNAGIKKFIGKYDINNELKKLSYDKQLFIKQEKEKLENTFRCFSLHCGGIVYYPNGVPKDILLNVNRNKTTSIKQIVLNKEQIAKDKNFKIDILSSRGLSQCFEINKYKQLDFESFFYDEKTFAMLHKGDNLGITLGESPLMRLAFIKIKPKTIYELAICLAIIRPAAKDARNCKEFYEIKDHIIFDDDAIDIISKEFNVSDEEADKYRRGFAKGCKETIMQFKQIIQHLDKDKQKQLMKKLHNLSKYGFCKAHALSYAQLIWKLAYMKAHYPLEFWKATLNNCDSSYKKWVHLYEAKLAGVNILNKQLKKDDVSIYANNRRKKLDCYSPQEQLLKYGYWKMDSLSFFPDCYLQITNGIYSYNGIIAAFRYKNKKEILLVYIGVGPRQYIQVNIDKPKVSLTNKIGVKGVGQPSNAFDRECNIVTSTVFEFY
jgi:superfamily II DNA or RNA helicase